MTRRLFGGTPADVAEATDGSRVANAAGTVWDGTGGNAVQITDLLDINLQPITQLQSDAQGMVQQFYGPDTNATNLWADFGAGRVLLVATDTGAELATHETADDPHGIKPWAEARFSNGGSVSMTVDDLLKDQVFYAAHRGSGIEAPEHTMEAYEYAVACGAKAIEVSVQATADGNLVCIHDTTLDRTTDQSGPVSAWPYNAARNAINVDSRDLLGNGWGTQKLTTLRDVLDRFLGKVVIFLEPKTNDASSILTGGWLMQNYPDCAKSVIWKVYYTNGTKQWAQSQGMKVWAYTDPTTTSAQLDSYDTNVDYWGVPHTATDAQVTMVVNRGKPVIVWEVARRSQRDHLAGLGVRGMMTPAIQYVRGTKQFHSADKWISQVAAPGCIGAVHYDPKYALRYDGTGAAYLDYMDRGSCVLGGMSIPTYPTNGYRIQFDMKFPVVPTGTLHSGIAFGKQSDDVYRASQTNTSGGYHLAIRANGTIDLLTHSTTSANGTIIATGTTTAPVANQWMTFQVDVTPTQVIVRRTDNGLTFNIAANNTAYRGGYVHLSLGTVTDPATKPYWRNFSVTAL